MTSKNPAPTATNPVGVRRVQPDCPLSGEVQRGGDQKDGQAPAAEPSTAERACWPDATRDYVWWLEGEQAKVAAMHDALVQITTALIMGGDELSWGRNRLIDVARDALAPFGSRP